MSNRGYGRDSRPDKARLLHDLLIHQLDREEWVRKPRVTTSIEWSDQFDTNMKRAYCKRGTSWLYCAAWYTVWWSQRPNAGSQACRQELNGDQHCLPKEGSSVNFADRTLKCRE